VVCSIYCCYEQSKSEGVHAVSYFNSHTKYVMCDDIGKYSFVNRTIQHWYQLLAEMLGTLPCKPVVFK